MSYFENMVFVKSCMRTSLVVQGLRLHASLRQGVSSIPGWGTKILHDTGHGKKQQQKKKKQKKNPACIK